MAPGASASGRDAPDIRLSEQNLDTALAVGAQARAIIAKARVPSQPDAVKQLGDDVAAYCYAVRETRVCLEVALSTSSTSTFAERLQALSDRFTKQEVGWLRGLWSYLNLVLHPEWQRDGDMAEDRSLLSGLHSGSLASSWPSSRRR
jgi:hypothetical protein